MTQPRFIIPGEAIFVTVRTIARFYLLRPDPELVEAMKCCLGRYAQRHGIVLHVICVMSTHIHLVAFDERGHRSPFLLDVNRGIANVVKALRGWRGPVFRPMPNIVRLLSQQAIIDKVAYTVANPVTAGAVRRFSDWPGLCDGAGLSERRQQVPRPQHFVLDPRSESCLNAMRDICTGRTWGKHANSHRWFYWYTGVSDNDRAAREGGAQSHC